MVVVAGCLVFACLLGWLCIVICWFGCMCLGGGYVWVWGVCWLFAGSFV